jgi:hypothetical protein
MASCRLMTLTCWPLIVFKIDVDPSNRKKVASLIIDSFFNLNLILAEEKKI